MGNFEGLGWIDDFIMSPGGISLKERIAVLTEKQWVTIHGHPVNIGGGSGSGGGGGGGGSGKPKKSGPGGSAEDGAFQQMNAVHQDINKHTIANVASHVLEASKLDEEWRRTSAQLQGGKGHNAAYAEHRQKMRALAKSAGTSVNKLERDVGDYQSAIAFNKASGT